MLLSLGQWIALVLVNDVLCNSSCRKSACVGLGTNKFDVLVEERQKTELEHARGKKSNLGFLTM